MADLEQLLDRLEALLGEIDGFDEPVRRPVFELLDGIDTLHRMALARLRDALDEDAVESARAAHPAVAWLLDAYDIGPDDEPPYEPPPPGPVPVHIRFGGR